MPFFVYSLEDVVSTGAAELLKGLADFREEKPINGLRCFGYRNMKLVEIPGIHVNADFLDELGADYIIFLSRHSSAKGVISFTVHPEGNWDRSAEIGGKPKQLATAAPVEMLKVLKKMSELNKTEHAVTYEATHHGPFLKTPSLYAELGGSEATWYNTALLQILAKSVLESVDADVPYDKIAIGIGGLHYEDRFARLALSGKYAFSHMMARHSVAELDMLDQAINRSNRKAEIAVIEWKSITAEERNKAVEKLNELGLDYVKI